MDRTISESIMPYSDLHRYELRIQIPRRAKFTRLQRVCWEAHVVNGESLKRTGECLGIGTSAATKHVLAAFNKAQGVEFVGLFTVMVEEFGVEAVRELLSGN